MCFGMKLRGWLRREKKQNITNQTMAQPSPSELATRLNEVTIHDPELPAKHDELEKVTASFPTMPTETRLCIWKLAMEETPRVVEIIYNPCLGIWLSPKQSQAPLPAQMISHVNHEAREEFLKSWSPLVPLAPTIWPKLPQNAEEGKKTINIVKSFPTSYFNPHVDTLYIGPADAFVIGRHADVTASLNALKTIHLLKSIRLVAWEVNDTVGRARTYCYDGGRYPLEENVVFPQLGEVWFIARDCCEVGAGDFTFCEERESIAGIWNDEGRRKPGLIEFESIPVDRCHKRAMGIFKPAVGIDSERKVEMRWKLLRRGGELFTCRICGDHNDNRNCCPNS